VLSHNLARLLMTFLFHGGRSTYAAKIWGRLTAWATDSYQIFWHLCGWRRRDTAL